ncbi:MAG: sigma-54 dependent transcriptional regulator [Bacteroidales bacterium]|nr:sigma-54 dependent transcriptional regulator [Bacteroidales bacterium]
MTDATILVIDADESVLSSLGSIMRREFRKVITLQGPERINETFRKNEIDIVLLDMNFRSAIHNGNEGFYWMKEIFRLDRNVSVVIVTATGDASLAARAIKEGAIDYIVRPWEESKLLATVNAAWQLRRSRIETLSLKNDNRALRREINRAGDVIISGASPTMINVMNIVKKVAPTDANVLITGENGTGKELVAREIHRLSARSEELMLTVDMGSITETLFESELFGHAKGAFTDARDERKGKIEQADRGTLFLDEIGNLSLQAQAKLLSVLQNRTIVKVGSNRPVEVDIRLICATNRNLQQMVQDGSFREDLLYRINTILIEVPPLRDRVDDIPVLAGHFLRIDSRRYGKEGLKLSTHALEKLSNYSWPGNVRELQHIIEKAVIMSESSVLKPSDFVFSTLARGGMPADMTLEELEKYHIGNTLKRCSGNISIAAAKLGVTRQTLYNKMSRYNL